MVPLQGPLMVAFERHQDMSRPNAQPLRSASCTSRRKRDRTGLRQPNPMLPRPRCGPQCRTPLRGRRTMSRPVPTIPIRAGECPRNHSGVALKNAGIPSTRTLERHQGDPAMTAHGIRRVRRSPGRPRNWDFGHSLPATSREESPEPRHLLVETPLGDPKAADRGTRTPESFPGGALVWYPRWILVRSSRGGRAAVTSRTIRHRRGLGPTVPRDHFRDRRRPSGMPGATCPGGVTPRIRAAVRATPAQTSWGDSGPIRRRRGWSRCAAKRGHGQPVRVRPASL